jgi:hypothetical protein
MRYEDIKDWKEQDFKRLAGVQHETFKKSLLWKLPATAKRNGLLWVGWKGDQFFFRCSSKIKTKYKLMELLQIPLLEL